MTEDDIRNHREMPPDWRFDLSMIQNEQDDDYKAAFHRTVVDHMLYRIGARYGRLEGRSIREQAIIVCEALDDLI